MYTVITVCFNKKYELIKEHWEQRIQKICINSNLEIITNNTLKLDESHYAWWDIIRMNRCISLLNENKIAVCIDMDIILIKDIKPLVLLEYDFIISTEIGGNKAYPQNCSEILGFGICSGFYIVKPKAINFLNKVYLKMNQQFYNSYSDQVTLMNYIINTPHIVEEKIYNFDNKIYKNKIITIDTIKICVLDFNIIIRDPICNISQFANHINIDNIGGSENFIKYFYNDLEKLPLTCRCGKYWLGDTSICSHIQERITI
jgi:hypothetical protein